MATKLEALLGRMNASKHPQADSLRSVVKGALGVAERLAQRRQELSRDGSLTPHGTRQKIREEIGRTFGPEYRAVRMPLKKAKARLSELKRVVEAGPPKPADAVAMMAQMELRSGLAAMTQAERTKLLLSSDTDPTIITAALSAPNFLANIGADLRKHMMDIYIAKNHPQEAAEISDLEAMIETAEAACEVAINDMWSVADVDAYHFQSLIKPFHSIDDPLPWLIKSGAKPDGTEAISLCEVGEDGRATYREATEAEVAIGRYYKNADEWKAAKAA